MSVDEETLKRDKLLLDLMLHTYDEEVARNELVDSKNSQMILLTGTMLSLQSTLLSNVLLNRLNDELLSLNWKIFLIVSLITSVFIILLSMFLFINAYKFKGTFKQIPSAKFLKRMHDEDVTSGDVIEKLLEKMPSRIVHNYGLIKNKTDTGRYGFVCLIIGSLLTLFFVLLICLSFFV